MAQEIKSGRKKQKQKRSSRAQLADFTSRASQDRIADLQESLGKLLFDFINVHPNTYALRWAEARFALISATQDFYDARPNDSQFLELKIEGVTGADKHRPITGESELIHPTTNASDPAK